MNQYVMNANILIVQRPEETYELPVNDYCWEYLFNHMDLMSQNNFKLVHPQFKNIKFNMKKPLIINNMNIITTELLQKFPVIEEAIINTGIFPVKPEYEKLTALRDLTIIDIAIPLDFIKSKEIINLKVSNSYHIFEMDDYLMEDLSRYHIDLEEFQTKDNIYPIMNISNNIETLEYSDGRLDTASLCRLILNPIKKLKFHNIYIHWDIQFAAALSLMEHLTDLTLTGRLSKKAQISLLKTYGILCRERLTKLTLELFEEHTFKYNVLVECSNLKEITIIYRKSFDLEEFYVHIRNLPKLKKIILKPNRNLKTKLKHTKIIDNLTKIFKTKGMTLEIQY